MTKKGELIAGFISTWQAEIPPIIACLGWQPLLAQRLLVGKLCGLTGAAGL